jgi:hypothetical protein
MALQSTAPILWPLSMRSANASPGTLANFTTLDAAAEYSGVVIQAREAMTISHVGFRCGTATGSPTADIRIETVDTATGLPTGTLWAANTNIVTAGGAITSNTFALHALTASASITRGQFFCVKIAYNGGTSLQTQVYAGAINSVLPYSVVNTGTPAIDRLTSQFNMALGSSTSTFYHVPGLTPLSTATNNAFNNTNSAKRGLKFQVPFKCRVVGVRWFPLAGTTSGDLNIVLEDSAGAELSSSSTALDGNLQAIVNTAMAEAWFDNSPTLSPATDYRLMLEPSSATNINITTVTLPSADYRQAWAYGTNCVYSTFASAAYDDTATTQLPLIDLIIDQLDDGVSAAAASHFMIG